MTAETTSHIASGDTARALLASVRSVRGHGFRRHGIGTWAAAIAAIVVVSWVVVSFATSPNISYEIVFGYLFSPRILSGLMMTVFITVVSMTLAVLLAIPLALMRLSGNVVLRTIASAYIWFFRGTPLLVQIIFWGYLGIVFPNIVLGVPFTDIVFFSEPTSAVIPVVVAGILAMFINEAAYTAEIVRAGILSIDAGQREAAVALGMTHRKLTARIVLPQAMRVIVPPLANNFIVMLKSTALLALIAVPELYNIATSISAQNLAQIELLMVAASWYLVVVTLLYIPQRMLERRFGRGFAASQGVKTA